MWYISMRTVEKPEYYTISFYVLMPALATICCKNLLTFNVLFKLYQTSSMISASSDIIDTGSCDHIKKLQ